jgi:hypothetical protein
MGKEKKPDVSPELVSDDFEDDWTEPANSRFDLRDILLAGVMVALLIQIVLSAFTLAAVNHVATLSNQANTLQSCVQHAQIDATSQTDYQVRFKKCLGE